MDEDRSDVAFLADECTFTQTVRQMEALGCDVRRVQDAGLPGASDAVVFRRAQEANSVLVTTDRGFGDIRTYPPSSHQGIIVLKVSPNPAQIRSVHRTLRTLLETENTFEGTLFIVDAQKYRKRSRP